MEEDLKIILISFVFFLASLGVFYFLDLPQYKEIVNKDRQIIQINTAIASKREYNEIINQQAQALEDAQWSVKEPSIAVNFTSSMFFIPKMQYFFQDLVTSSGLVLGAVSYSTPVSVRDAPAARSTAEIGTKTSTPAGQEVQSSSASSTYYNLLTGPVMKTSFNLSVTGTYDALKSFLTQLEGQTRIVNVRSIVLSPTTVQASAGAKKPVLNTVSFQIIVDAYSY